MKISKKMWTRENEIGRHELIYNHMDTLIVKKLI